MYGLLVLWDLSESTASFEELRTYIAERSIPRFEQVEGLRQKTWISSPETRRWGAFYLFEQRDQAEAIAAATATSPVNDITGCTPTTEIFDVEAVVEGRHTGTELLLAGLARAR